jgi:hypothetical protein
LYEEEQREELIFSTRQQRTSIFFSLALRQFLERKKIWKYQDWRNGVGQVEQSKRCCLRPELTKNSGRKLKVCAIGWHVRRLKKVFYARARLGVYPTEWITSSSNVSPSNIQLN